MHTIISGAGEVGGHAAEVLSNAGHSVTVLDLSADRVRLLGDRLDVRTLIGHCAHVESLLEAGIDSCDLFVAATDVDEINMLGAALAKQLGAKKTVVRVHHTANYALREMAASSNLGIDVMLCPEHLTALEIARTLRNPGSIALEEFSSSELLMQRMCVTAGAPACGKVLSELTMPRSVRVATIENKDGPSIAQATSRLDDGDFVTVIGETRKFEVARKLFTKHKERKQHVAIMGGSAISVWLCRVLRTRFFSVRLFVQDHERAAELADKLEHVTVLEADPTDATVFTDEQIDKTDVFIAATDDDEDNMLACAQAKALGTADTVTILQRNKYMHLMAHIGINHAFCPRNVAVNSILSLIDVGPIRSVASIADKSTVVFEVHPTKKASVIGKELRHITMPPKSMIAAICRDKHAYVPGADDHVEDGDLLLVIAPVAAKAELQKLFITK